MEKMDKMDKRRPPSPAGKPPRGPRRHNDPGGKSPGGFNWKRSSRTGLFWIAIIVLAVLAMQALSATKVQYTEIDYSDFLLQLEADNVAKVTFVERWLQGELITALQNDPGKKPAQFRHFKMLLPLRDPELLPP